MVSPSGTEGSPLLSSGGPLVLPSGGPLVLSSGGPLFVLSMELGSSTIGVSELFRDICPSASGVTSVVVTVFSSTTSISFSSLISARLLLFDLTGDFSSVLHVII